MIYTIAIIIAALTLGLVNIKDQVSDNDTTIYRFIIKLICMAVIIVLIVLLENKYN